MLHCFRVQFKSDAPKFYCHWEVFLKIAQVSHCSVWRPIGVGASDEKDKPSDRVDILYVSDEKSFLYRKRLTIYVQSEIGAFSLTRAVISVEII